MKGMDCIYLAYYRNKWLTVVNMIRNSHFPSTAWKPEGMRSCGRLTCRWEYNIKRDYYRDKWLAVVKSVTDLHFHNMWEFFD
jgi:hypothetical protein